MAVGTATKKQAQTEVETSAEEEVIVDPNLNRLIEKWDSNKATTEKSWMRIAEYVRDKEITSKQLRHALVEIHGLSPGSANVEVSRFMRFQKSQEASDMLDRALEGDEEITVRDLRSAKVMQGERAEKDPEEQVEKKLLATARFAILKAGSEDIGEYVGIARRTYKTAAASIERLQAKAEGDGDQEEEEETEEE